MGVVGAIINSQPTTAIFFSPHLFIFDIGLLTPRKNFFLPSGCIHTIFFL